MSRDIDEELSVAYRNLPSDRTPADLDEKILAAARQEVRQSRAGTWRETWYRPVTFVATVGLSLALILQLSDTGILDPGGVAEDDLNGMTPMPESALQEAARATADQIRQIESAAEQSMPSSGQPMETGVAVPADTGSLLPVDGGCDDEQRSSSTDWWQCIQDLEKRGLSQVAERELQALLRAYPGFAAPNQAPDRP
jgi:hypothetical protein